MFSGKIFSNGISRCWTSHNTSNTGSSRALLHRAKATIAFHSEAPTSLDAMSLRISSRKRQRCIGTGRRFSRAQTGEDANSRIMQCQRQTSGMAELRIGAREVAGQPLDFNREGCPTVNSVPLPQNPHTALAHTVLKYYISYHFSFHTFYGGYSHGIFVYLIGDFSLILKKRLLSCFTHV